MPLLRYALLRAELFLGSLRTSLLEGGADLGGAVAKALTVARAPAPFTKTLWFRSAAMVPLLSAQGEALLVRELQPWARRLPGGVRVGDVVTLGDPRGETPLLVRRVTAVAGDEMVSSVAGEDPFKLEEGFAWVEAVSESVSVAEAADSRSFGPVPLHLVQGRVLYAMKHAADHGRVGPIGEMRSADEAVLCYDLNLDELARTAEKGTAASHEAAAGLKPTKHAPEAKAET